MALSFILKTTEEYWLTDRDSVDRFHKDMLRDATEQDYQLASFSYTEKYVKESGEIVDSYFIVKVTKVFDDPKEPEKTPLVGISYLHKGDDEPDAE